jgi:small RNA 2'-O-methyltransferase
MEESTLHAERLDAVLDVLRREGVDSVLDLGCGAGSLLERLAADPRFTRVLGIDTSAEALRIARRRTAHAAARVSVRCASFVRPDPDLAGFGAAVLVETIEHLPAGRLAELESALFETIRPRIAVITTPNRDFNPLLGLAEGELRHLDHAFEWGRSRFRAWAEGTAARNRYRVGLAAVGRADPLLGSPTQMAIFRRDEG